MKSCKYILLIYLEIQLKYIVVLQVHLYNKNLIYKSTPLNYNPKYEKSLGKVRNIFNVGMNKYETF